MLPLLRVLCFKQSRASKKMEAQPEEELAVTA